MIELIECFKLTSNENRLTHLFEDFILLCQELAENGTPVGQFPLFDKTFSITEEVVSYGTRNPSYLYYAFLFEFFNRGHYRTFYHYYREVYNKVRCHESDAPISSNPHDWNWDYLNRGAVGKRMKKILQEMIGGLSEIAPEGYYFGSHKDDNSLFGYWRVGA